MTAEVVIFAGWFPSAVCMSSVHLECLPKMSRFFFIVGRIHLCCIIGRLGNFQLFRFLVLRLWGWLT